jgi:hypothetical protein
MIFIPAPMTDAEVAEAELSERSMRALTSGRGIGRSLLALLLPLALAPLTFGGVGLLLPDGLLKIDIGSPLGEAEDMAPVQCEGQ